MYILTLVSQYNTALFCLRRLCLVSDPFLISVLPFHSVRSPFEAKLTIGVVYLSTDIAVELGYFPCQS